MIIEVDNNENFGEDFFSGLEEGDNIFRINFRGKKYVRTDRGNRTGHCQDLDQKNCPSYLLVVKETEVFSSGEKYVTESTNGLNGDLLDNDDPIFFYKESKSNYINNIVSDFNSKRYGMRKSVQLARCIHTEVTGEDNSKIRYYIAGYDKDMYKNEDWGNDVKLYTALYFNKPYYWENDVAWADYKVSEIQNLRIDPDNPAVFALNDWEVNAGSNEVVKYRKKLDEIAWYSKIDYPYIGRGFDPGAPGNTENIDWKELPFPQSYKRAKFNYNYELAKGTPNSISDELVEDDSEFKGGGRLTLKELYYESGPEYKSITSPPYLFSYQGAEIKFSETNEFKGYKNRDTYGMRSPDGIEKNIDYYNDNKRGVNWNLSKIITPSCHSIEIDYERDCMDSTTLTSIFKAKDKNVECGPNKYMPSHYDDVSNSFDVLDCKSRRVIVESEKDITDYIDRFCYFRNEAGRINTEYKYYQIQDVNLESDNSYKIIFNKPLVSIHDDLEPSSSEFDVEMPKKVYVLNKYGPVYTDGIRVKNIKYNSLENNKNTLYDYGPGIMNYIPFSSGLENYKYSDGYDEIFDYELNPDYNEGIVIKHAQSHPFIEKHSVEGYDYYRCKQDMSETSIEFKISEFNPHTTYIVYAIHPIVESMDDDQYIKIVTLDRSPGGSYTYTMELTDDYASQIPGTDKYQFVDIDNFNGIVYREEIPSEHDERIEHYHLENLSSEEKELLIDNDYSLYKYTITSPSSSLSKFHLMNSGYGLAGSIYDPNLY
ncbi:MAG: hypothetical protein ACOCSL_05760, partial [Thermoplasmatota archaeon]